MKINKISNKRIITFFVCLCAAIKCLAQQSAYNGNTEGTVFWTDSVYLFDYSVVKSGINGHRFILLEKTVKISGRNKKFWNKDGVIIYSDFIFINALLHSCIRFYYAKGFSISTIDSLCTVIWPGGVNSPPHYYFDPPFDGKDYFCDSDTLDYKPTFFRVFLVRGDVYNKLTGNCIDCGTRHIKFRRRKKLYTVYVPIR